VDNLVNFILQHEEINQTGLILKGKEEKIQKDDIITTINFDNCNKVATAIDDAIKNKIVERIKEIFSNDSRGYGYESPWVPGKIILPTVCEINLTDNTEIKEYAIGYPIPGGSYVDIYKKTGEGWKMVLTSSGIMIIQIEKGKTGDMHNILIVNSLGAGNGTETRYKWNYFIEKYEKNQEWKY